MPIMSALAARVGIVAGRAEVATVANAHIGDARGLGLSMAVFMANTEVTMPMADWPSTMAQAGPSRSMRGTASAFSPPARSRVT